MENFRLEYIFAVFVRQAILTKFFCHVIIYAAMDSEPTCSAIEKKQKNEIVFLTKGYFLKFTKNIR